MLGAFSVGKTSLVEQFVHSIFSSKYLSTIGVKISKKEIDIDGQIIQLVLWDMEGQDIYADVNLSYLRGAMGFFVVADGTRMETIDIALTTRQMAIKMLGDAPNCLIVNKADIQDQWEVPEETLAGLEKKGIKIFRTSAKNGTNIEDAFRYLAEQML